MRLVLIAIAGLAACGGGNTVPRAEACTDWAMTHCECFAAQEAMALGDAGFDQWMAMCVSDSADQCASGGGVHADDLDACLVEIGSTIECLGDDPSESNTERAVRCGSNACFDHWAEFSGTDSACAWTGL